ncbi:MAG: hypothetical protein H6624_10845 [Bdellovibrionaceae bacterium]|nr:hypothetical protein [Bdellovibrionales bacterium]MCB9084834.1 hypothetical protein [Pseudobdellovibrionaceae bacterium]
MNSQPVVRKKVSPYPIDLNVQREGKVVTMKILKLTERGMIVDTTGIILKVASSLPEASFTIPLTEVVIAGPLRVIKNYDRTLIDGEKNRSVQRLTEFHFLQLSDQHRQEIRGFLVRIKQVAP